MKYIFVNLKRFDVPAAYGGINYCSSIQDWASSVLRPIDTSAWIRSNTVKDVSRVFFVPEGQIITAKHTLRPDSPLDIGAQSLAMEDVSPGKNFGALTTSFPAAAAAAMGCHNVLIGHCEERKALSSIIHFADGDEKAIDRILNLRVRRAGERGLKTLFCIGETELQHSDWKSVLARQLEAGLSDAPLAKLVIAYEPIWAIGPGKTPPCADYIGEVARYVKRIIPQVPFVYGGGLKLENASMLSHISEVDGGLIALTRFSGDIGFYPQEYIAIEKAYFNC